MIKRRLNEMAESLKNMIVKLENIKDRYISNKITKNEARNETKEIIIEVIENFNFVKQIASKYKSLNAPINKVEKMMLEFKGEL